MLKEPKHKAALLLWLLKLIGLFVPQGTDGGYIFNPQFVQFGKKTGLNIAAGATAYSFDFPVPFVNPPLVIVIPEGGMPFWANPNGATVSKLNYIAASTSGTALTGRGITWFAVDPQFLFAPPNNQLCNILPALRRLTPVRGWSLC
jgi:hypothetical protein